MSQYYPDIITNLFEGPRHQLGKCVGAVADRMLLRRIDFRISQHITGRNEHRIIAEPQPAARRPGQAALRPALENLGMTVGPRSEESRVGKAGVSTCRSRWSPYR